MGNGHIPRRPRCLACHWRDKQIRVTTIVNDNYRRFLAPLPSVKATGTSRMSPGEKPMRFYSLS
jgi:hypothetical protein